jgi:glycosyltransferase involved in cell wall biosynthesis
MPHLAVFSSNNSGLNTWNRVGSLHREVAIYKQFTEHEWDVSFYTYDQSRKLPDIGFTARIHPQWPWLLPKKFGFLYRGIMPFLFYCKGKKTDIIITNQAHSSGTTYFAGRLWRAKIVARCGYVYGESAETLAKSGKRVKKRILAEKHTFEEADKCVVPTQALAEWIFDNYGIPHDKIEVIPNYVDTEKFKSAPNCKKRFDIICIGRLVEKKRNKLLLEALADTQLKIHFIGSGRLKDELKSLANKSGLELQITPSVEHTLLPQHINSSRIYVNLASWEGHPKALIEAMACGCPCIGAKSPGIENLIIDGQTGLLVDPEHKQIYDAVERLLQDTELANRLGKNARDYASKHFSLDKIFCRYKEIFEKLLVK